MSGIKNLGSTKAHFYRTNCHKSGQPSMLQVTDDLSDFAAFPVTAPPMLKSKKSPVVAFILCWAVGSLGIHRFYLGTKTMTGVGYILTCGGLGIVTFVDWIVLLIGVIEDDVKKYVDNPRFFMW